MSRSRLSRGSPASENITDLLSCSVCMEVFDEGQHQPKLLPCHHSFCLQCLTRLVTSHEQSQLFCPTCRQLMILPAPGTAGIKALQTNFYITSMKDLLDESSIKIKGCRKHGNKELSYFCRSCEIPICPNCCLTEHKDSEGHSTAILAIAREDQVRLLEVEITEAKQHLLFNKSHLEKLDVEVKVMTAAKSRALLDIEKEFQVLQKNLQDRKAQLEELVNQTYRDKSDPLQMQITSLLKEDNALEGLLEQCTDAKKNGAISDLMAYRAKMMHKNKDINESHSSVVSTGSNFIEFDSKHNMHEILSAIKRYGNVTATKKIPCKVKLNEFHRIIAGLFTSMSFTMHSFDDEPLDKVHGLEIEVRDAHDDKLPCLVNDLGDGRYEITFRPAVSGAHHARVTVCTTGIVSEFPLNVHSNNPCAVIGEYGCLEGQMVYPRALAVDRHNNIYVVDTGNNRIQKLDKSGQFLLEFPIAAENENISSCGIAIDYTRSMLICPEVNMHEADLTHADAVLYYTLDGTLKKRLGMSDFLRKGLSVAVNSIGQTIIADLDLNSIFILDAHGRILHRFGEKGAGPGQFNNPTFVCVGDKDNIIVSDSENHRIQIFDRNGGFLSQFGSKGTGKGQFNMPFGVAADCHGNILVTDGGNKRIQIFKQSGDFLGCIESLDDKLNAPRGIAVTNDGYVLVADRDNNCIKKFKYLLCSSV